MNLKKQFSILMWFLYFFTFASLSAIVVQIGSGTNLNCMVPVEPFMTYSYSQTLYSPQEVQFSGTITALSFQYRIVSNLFLSCSANWTIFLGQVNRTNFFNDSPWIAGDSLIVVFNGSLQQGWFSSTLPGEGWVTIPITPFTYNGVQNLVVAVDENAISYSSNGDDFYCTTVAGTLYPTVHFWSDIININPLSPQSEASVGFRRDRPNIRINIEPIQFTPHTPFPANMSTNIDPNITLSWQSDADSFDLLFSVVGFPLQTLATGLTQYQWTISAPLQLLTTYQWQVIGYENGTPFPSPVWQFTTRGENLTAPLNLTGILIGEVVHLSWQPPAEGSIVSYRIFRDNTQIDEVQDTFYEDIQIQPGNTYLYYVKGVNYLNQITPSSNVISVTVPGPINDLQQTFEQYPDFSLSIPQWMLYDLDQSITWEFDWADFPHEGSPLSWIVFNPLMTVPPLTEVTPHSGQKMLVCFDATNPPNNDWLISPRLLINSNTMLSFWVRSWTADYGLERLKVLISTTDTQPSSFVCISSGNWLSVPAVWTQYQLNLSSYAGKSIYLAWQCVSWDAFALCLDDILVTNISVSVIDEAYSYPYFRVYPNPAKDYFRIETTDKQPFDLCIYNLKGEKVYSQSNLSGFIWTANQKIKLSTGLYILKLDSANKNTCLKLVLY